MHNPLHQRSRKIVIHKEKLETTSRRIIILQAYSANAIPWTIFHELRGITFSLNSNPSPVKEAYVADASSTSRTKDMRERQASKTQKTFFVFIAVCNKI